jgi:hypothetical protein
MREPPRRNLRAPSIVVKLTRAIYQGSCGTCHLYVPFPFRNPSPCLAVSADSQGRADWEGLVVALPNLQDNDHEKAHHPQFAAALGIIESSGEAVIRNCQDLVLFQDLFDLPASSSPFTDVPARDVQMILDQVLGDLEEASLISLKIAACVRATETRLAAASRWSPLVVDKVDVPLKHFENWELLLNWERWLAETSKLSDLARMFYSHTLGSPSVAQGSTLDVKARDVRAFRKRLAYLGLPASKESIQDFLTKQRHFT